MDEQLLHTWTREGLLYFPPALATISLAFVTFKLVRVSLKQNAETDVGEHTSGVKDGNLLQRFDGAAILIFRILRLLTVFALLGLEVFELSVGMGSSARVFQTPFFVCPLVISISLY